MKILTFSTLFPNNERPNHGIFVETRLRELVASGEVDVRVVAPVPWFPLKNPTFGRYAMYAKAQLEEERFGIKVFHPRYLLPPKVGMVAAPFLLASAMKRHIQQIIVEGFDFDLIDAHYFYPDGVAAAMLGRHFGKPVVITARGSDVTLIPRYALPRKMIIWAANHAAGVITVCEALKNELVSLGVRPGHITALRNGVDLERFRPIERDSQGSQQRFDGFTLLSVGNLLPVKGHDLVISSLPMLADVRLLIAGTGPDRKTLEELALRLGVAHRVTFLGSLPQSELRNYYGAADALVLASSREGWANVLLESMACGTPVIASNVWGTPEVVASTDAGLLFSQRTPQAVAEAVKTLRANYPNRAATRRYAENFGWVETTRGQIKLFRKILGGAHL